MAELLLLLLTAPLLLLLRRRRHGRCRAPCAAANALIMAGAVYVNGASPKPVMRFAHEA